MPAFDFRALTTQGAAQRGVVSAPSEQAAKDRLRQEGLIPLTIVHCVEMRDIHRPRRLEALIQFRLGALFSRSPKSLA